MGAFLLVALVAALAQGYIWLIVATFLAMLGTVQIKLLKNKTA